MQNLVSNNFQLSCGWNAKRLFYVSKIYGGSLYFRLTLEFLLFINMKLSGLIFKCTFQCIGRDWKGKMMWLEHNPVYSRKGSVKWFRFNIRKNCVRNLCFLHISCGMLGKLFNTLLIIFIVDLQHCISFTYAAKWISYT